jgi:hypothetical protein
MFTLVTMVVRRDLVLLRSRVQTMRVTPSHNSTATIGKVVPWRCVKIVSQAHQAVDLAVVGVALEAVWAVLVEVSEEAVVASPELVEASEVVGAGLVVGSGVEEVATELLHSMTPVLLPLHPTLSPILLLLVGSAARQSTSEM